MAFSIWQVKNGTFFEVFSLTLTLQFKTSIIIVIESKLIFGFREIVYADWTQNGIRTTESGLRKR